MSRLLVILAVLILLLAGARQLMFLIGRRFQRTPLGMVFATLREAQRQASNPAVPRSSRTSAAPARLRRCAECGDHVPDPGDRAPRIEGERFECETCRQRSSSP